MRRPFKVTSIRARLTLFSVGVLVLALLGCALTVHLTVKALLMRSIDRDLASEAKAALSREPKDNVVYQQVMHELPPNSRHMIASLNGRAFPDHLPDMQELPPDSSHMIAQYTWRYQRGGVRAGIIAPDSPNGHDPGAPLPVKAVTAPPPFSERHRFVLLRLIDGQGKPLLPLPNADLPDNSTWNRQFALARGGERCATLIMRRQSWRVLTMPHREDGKIVGVAQVAYPLQELNSLLRGLDGALLALFPPVLLLAGAGSAFLTGRALHPVSRITRAAMEVEARDLSRRLPVAGGDELAELATTFNSMFDRLEAAFAQLEAAVERQQRFTADASHELRTPLTTVRANADWALRKPRSATNYQEALRSILQAADRTDQLIESLLYLARSDSGRMSPMRESLCLDTVLRRAVASTPRDAASPPVSLDLPAALPQVEGDAEQLERVFTNLLQNALRHTPADGSVRLSAREDGGDIVVTVADTGEGIAPEHLQHVCERFYRVDAARSRPAGGAGLGLAICQSIVAAHGGALQIESEVGAGTRIQVRLPRAASEQHPAPIALD